MIVEYQIGMSWINCFYRNWRIGIKCRCQGSGEDECRLIGKGRRFDSCPWHYSRDQHFLPVLTDESSFLGKSLSWIDINDTAKEKYYHYIIENQKSIICLPRQVIHWALKTGILLKFRLNLWHFYDRESQAMITILWKTSKK